MQKIQDWNFKANYYRLLNKGNLFSFLKLWFYCYVTDIVIFKLFIAFYLKFTLEIKKKIKKHCHYNPFKTIFSESYLCSVCHLSIYSTLCLLPFSDSFYISLENSLTSKISSSKLHSRYLDELKYPQLAQIIKHSGSGQTLGSCQVPTQLLSLPLLIRIAGENRSRQRQGEHSLITIVGKTNSAWGKIIQFIAN